MPLLKEVADRLSQNVLLAGVIEEIITEDDLFNILDFRQVNGKSLTYNRELALPSADFLAPNDTVNESAGTVEEVNTVLRAIIGDVDVDNFLNEVESDTNSQLAIQIAMKAKTVARKFADQLVNGDAYQGALSGGDADHFTLVRVSDENGKGTGTIEFDVSEGTARYAAPGDSAGEFVDISADGTYTLKSAQPSRYVVITVTAANAPVADSTTTVTITETKGFTGLKSLVKPAQVIAAGANGGALSFDLLDELLDKVKGGPVHAIVMHERTIRAYKALLRTAGGVDSAMLQLPNFGRPVLTVSGIPIIKNNWLPTNEAKGASGNVCTSVYAVNIGPAGFQGLYGGPEAGIRIEPIGPVQNKDATRTRVKWYCGTALYGSLAVARLEGVTD